MNTLRFYAAVSRLGRLSYRMKILLMAFVGTHVPLLAIIIFSAMRAASGEAVLWIIAVALISTLLGMIATLYVLNALLQPVLLTSRALRAYRAERELVPLPTDFVDEAGTLMADAGATLKELDEVLVGLQTTDEVTRLPNRNKLVDAVSAGIEVGEATVVVVRLGNFIRLRSTYDRKNVDEFIQTLAARMRKRLAPEALLARIDPVNFGIFVRDRETAESVRSFLTDLAHPIPLDGIEVMPDLMAGVATLPEGGLTAEDLIENATVATGRTTEKQPVSFHSAKAREEAKNRFALEQDLRRAVAANEFRLHYQPVVDLRVGRTIGAEALVRWQHPDRGLVPPGMFIPAAEQSGLIDDIGRWVIQEACMQVRRWQDEELNELKVAVNLSARQFLDARLTDYLAEAITAAGVSADALEIELTESAAMLDYEYTRRAFGKLRDLGVSVAIDDFGTGYASMSYLRKLPFSKLKIDREFVTNVDQSAGEQAICNAMITLGHGLGLKVLAEGTERAEEVSYLSGQGIDLFQGYFFSKAVPAEEFAETAQDIRMRLAAATSADARRTA